METSSQSQPRGRAWPSHREYRELGKRCGLGTNKAQTRLLRPGGGSKEVLQGGGYIAIYAILSVSALSKCISFAEMLGGQ